MSALGDLVTIGVVGYLGYKIITLLPDAIDTVEDAVSTSPVVNTAKATTKLTEIATRDPVSFAQSTTRVAGDTITTAVADSSIDLAQAYTAPSTIGLATITTLIKGAVNQQTGYTKTVDETVYQSSSDVIEKDPVTQLPKIATPLIKIGGVWQK